MANTENFAGVILNGMEDIVENLKWGDKPILKSNEPINKLGKFIMGDVDTGIRGTLHNLSKAGDLERPQVASRFHRHDRMVWLGFQVQRSWHQDMVGKRRECRCRSFRVRNKHRFQSLS